MQYSLWKISNAEVLIETILEDDALTDEQRNEMIVTKMNNLMTANETVNQIVEYQDNIESTLDMIKQKRNELNDRIKTLESKSKYIKNGIIEYMEKTGKQSIDTGEHKITLCETQFVNITNDLILPKK